MAMGLRARLAAALTAVALLGAAPAPVVSYADQGWSPSQRARFYGTGQGSRIMPYAWFAALTRADDGTPFSADQLARYGYLHNADPAAPAGLPLGFVLSGSGASARVGMTCAACHTGQLEYQRDGETRALRLDGAPALTDFQGLLADLTAAARATLASPARFDAFAHAVLGRDYGAGAAARLRSDFAAWTGQFGAFMDASLPPTPWGPGRLDAFGMIFNRVAGRDIGIGANFAPADAPVSYPFLWDAARQDHTQWTGSVPNWLFIQSLGRNTGEAFGVFTEFKPGVIFPSTWFTPTLLDYKNNSADFAGLETLEETVSTLRPPPWPRDLFGLDEALAARGLVVFNANCAACHGERTSPELASAWATPVKAVGTDPKMAINSSRMVDPGLFNGSVLPPPPFGAVFTRPAKASDLLASAVVGSLLAEAFVPPVITPDKLATSGVWRAVARDLATRSPGEQLDIVTNPDVFLKTDPKAPITTSLSGLYRKPATADAGAAYESRVLHGVWATAPYLHNGSVANLWELLTPPARRMTRFAVGSRTYDPRNVGWATDRSPYPSGVFVADPARGNGNGGHDYGTGLSDADRWALIEYMKTL